MKRSFLFSSVAILIFLFMMAGCQPKNEETVGKTAGHEENRKTVENKVTFFETEEKITSEAAGDEESSESEKNEEADVEVELPGEEAENMPEDFIEEEASGVEDEAGFAEDEAGAIEDEAGVAEEEADAVEDEAFYEEEPSEEDLM